MSTLGDEQFTTAWESWMTHGSITDQELSVLSRRFDELTSTLRLLGPKWYLAWREAHAMKLRLDDIKFARKQARKQGWYKS